MKRFIPLLLCFALLSGCGRKSPDQPLDPPPVPPAPQESEVITFAVSPYTYEDQITADDGTLLVNFRFVYPTLSVLANGTAVETPSTPAQQAAQAKADTFNAAFAQLTDTDSLQETIAMAEEQYGYMAAEFQSGVMHYTDEFDYDCRQTDGLVSVSAMRYTYLGGAHGYTDYKSWLFDLKQGQFITLPELTEEPEVFVAAVVDSMEAQALAEFQKPEYGLGDTVQLDEIYWPDYRDVMETWPETAAAYPDADGLQIIFPAYALAAYAAGPQMFTIPYAELDSYWSDAGRAMLGLNG